MITLTLGQFNGNNNSIEHDDVGQLAKIFLSKESTIDRDLCMGDGGWYVAEVNFSKIIQLLNCAIQDIS